MWDTTCQSLAMPQSEIHADPERLKEIISNMPVFAKDLKAGLADIMSAFKRLGDTWKDDEYDGFKRCLEPLRETIDEMTREFGSHQKSLQNDLENLIHLQQIFHRSGNRIATAPVHDGCQMAAEIRSRQHDFVRQVN